MQNYNDAPIVSAKVSSIPNSDDYQKELDLKAQKLLADFQAGMDAAIENFKTRHPVGKREGFTPTLMDARQVVMFENMEGKTLSLENLKKQAKRFLKDIKSGDEIAHHRAQAIHPKVMGGIRHLNELTLTDTQHILALENGFTSWPKLKHHLSAMEAANDLVRAGKTLDVPHSLHIRCGNDIKPVLTDAGLRGVFMEVINPFSMGPVLPDRLEPVSLKIRSEYMSRVLGPYIEEDRQVGMTQSLVDEEEALLALPGDYTNITLWFEHDAYDQLCLAYVLHHMSRHSPKLDFTLDLVQVDKFPGVKRFVGIGQLSNQPAAIALLYQQRIPVTPAMISFGATMWEAYTSNDPTTLWRLCNEKNAPLPLMQNAMLRMLDELPHPKNGLGLTERLALDIIAKEGELLARRTFLFSMAERDPQPYHGDIMFFAILKEMYEAEHPALEVTGHVEGPGDFGKEVLKLTALGEKLHEGAEDWIRINKIQKWVGGVEISPDKKQNWYFDRGTGPVLI